MAVYKMASKLEEALNNETLLSMIPVVMDFLDVNNEDIIASGILDDDYLDDAVLAMILSHRQHQTSSASKRDQLHESSGIPKQGLTVVPLQREEIDDFRQLFRMTQTMFDRLMQDSECTSLAKKQVASGVGGDGSSQSASFMMHLTLRFLGCQEPFDSLAEAAAIPIEVYKNVVYETLDSLFELLPKYVDWPVTQALTAAATETFQQVYGLSGIIGTIDALHVKIVVPDELAHGYVNPDGETTVVLQSVCDHRLCFLHCCTGWPGSISEDKVLKDSDLYTDVNNNMSAYFREDTGLIGGSKYSSVSWLRTPYRATSSPSLTSSQCEFNAACKNALENHQMAFRLLLQRFPRLECLALPDMQRIVVCILVCCALHNFCLDQGDLVLFEDTKVKVRNFINHRNDN